jgi:2-polyprenyl-3-methyl-5-hydroxy-6-metoxy-1,4-benzoquinol methylase
MNCRHCDKKLEFSMLDLGSSPPSNSFLSNETINQPEKWYPLNILVCENCWLVQTEDFVDAHEMFSDDYAYFSSYSGSFLKHCESFVSQMIKRFDLTSESLFVEVAANDGYLLQYVLKSGIPCYGVEPTENTANEARKKGIKIIQSFFGEETALNLSSKNLKADFMCANNVLAHVPNINDFVKGFQALLNPTGVATFENPHLLNLINENQFDTVYHEHYSYLSVTSVNKIFASNGLTLFDVQEIPTHGGSLRYFAQNSQTGIYPISKNVKTILNKEKKYGINKVEFYKDFQDRAEKIKLNLLSFLIDQKDKGKKVIAYGAAAKGNTLLNYCGIKSNLLEYIVDKNPSKQNMYTPGTRIPIYNIDKIKIDKPDFILILPWNLKNEIINQLFYVKQWDAKFVTAIPTLEIYNN